LKSTSNGITVLKEGPNVNINDFDVADELRVDAQGSDFTFHINGILVSKISDPDFTTGEIGFFVQTLDAASLHVHYDSLTIRKFEAAGANEPELPSTAVLYQDIFTLPNTGWAEEKFDNFFIGYHEPEYYHVAITSPSYKTTVFVPDKPAFIDATIEVKAFTFAGKTAETGDFRYGIAFRRSGDQYYAFTISQRTKKWAIMKSTPNELQVLKEGISESINAFDTPDTLRVDVKGPTSFFHINDEFLTQLDDPDYASGEVGFFVQTLDAASVHIHYDTITVREFEASPICSITALQMHIRSGPGTSHPSITYLSKDDVVKPTGINSDGKWVYVKNVADGQTGWIANVPDFVSCNSTLDVLPILNP
jgi:hypothetical protein